MKSWFVGLAGLVLAIVSGVMWASLAPSTPSQAQTITMAQYEHKAVVLNLAQSGIVADVETLQQRYGVEGWELWQVETTTTGYSCETVSSASTTRTNCKYDLARSYILRRPKP